MSRCGAAGGTPDAFRAPAPGPEASGVVPHTPRACPVAGTGGAEASVGLSNESDENSRRRGAKSRLELLVSDRPKPEMSEEIISMCVREEVG